MVKAYFGDIRNIIVEELLKSEHYIYIAVAWFTDREIYNILRQKLNDNVVVKMVIVKDVTNLNSGIDLDEFKLLDGHLFWDNHHHKFCVIDGKTLITGSYNWTYKAMSRFGRENIIVVKNEETLIKDYSSEFQMLLKKSEKHIVRPKEIIVYNQKEIPIIKEVPVFVERIIEDLIVDRNIRKAGWFNTHQKRTDWWKMLNEEWKKIYSDSNLVLDIKKPQKEELQYIFNSNELVFNTDLISIKDTIGLQNLSRLKEVKGLNLDPHARRILEQILPECRIID